MEKTMEQWLSSKQAAHFLGLTVGTLANWRSLGQGPQFKKFGRAVRYNNLLLQQWALEQHHPPQHQNLPTTPHNPDLEATVQLLQTKLDDQAQQTELWKTRATQTQRQNKASTAEIATLRRKLDALNTKLRNARDTLASERRLQDQQQDHLDGLNSQVELVDTLQVAVFANNKKGKVAAWEISVGNLQLDSNDNPFFRDDRNKRWWPATTSDDMTDLARDYLNNE